MSTFSRTIFLKVRIVEVIRWLIRASNRIWADKLEELWENNSTGAGHDMNWVCFEVVGIWIVKREKFGREQTRIGAVGRQDGLTKARSLTEFILASLHCQLPSTSEQLGVTVSRSWSKKVATAGFWFHGWAARVFWLLAFRLRFELNQNWRSVTDRICYLELNLWELLYNFSFIFFLSMPSTSSFYETCSQNMLYYTANKNLTRTRLHANVCACVCCYLTARL